jgi:16S rRNA (guanine966-N2)-methyltransferase
VNLNTLGADHCRVVRADTLRWLAGHRPDTFFDLVFLDPPFDDNLLGPACRLLEAGGWLAPAARIYLEAPSHREPPELPPGWEIIRDRTAGAVRYMLVVVEYRRDLVG